MEVEAVKKIVLKQFLFVVCNHLWVKYFIVINVVHSID